MPQETSTRKSARSESPDIFSSVNRALSKIPLLFFPSTSTLEISTANANGVTVTADSAHALGSDLARALRKFLE